ncbi:type II toxin-antitoxin system VapC family toxin [Methylobacter sp. Wu8]|uniref:type II toxin-antitoxin system VapC family toxin n=1 Tax=Methylobacter sp. Wu8 TaxID=3118457 RepID=UPI002F346313|nr:type II toxin-antitoxin system VapC family toxin [Methylococcales bacterium]
MRLLLDTHTFIWFIEGHPDLSALAKNLIEDPKNERFLSIASLWEIAIKTSLGRLNLNPSIQQLVDDHVYGNAIDLLPIAPSCLDRLANLVFYHKDPFDRLIIAQAMVEKLTIVGKDGLFAGYDVDCVW